MYSKWTNPISVFVWSLFECGIQHMPIYEEMTWNGTVLVHQKFQILFQFCSTLYREFCWFDHTVAGSFIGCWKGKTNPPSWRSWKHFVLLSETATSDLLWCQTRQTAKSKWITRLWEVSGKILQMVVFYSFETTLSQYEMFLVFMASDHIITNLNNLFRIF